MTPEEKSDILLKKIDHVVGLTAQLIQNIQNDINRLELQIEEMHGHDKQSNIPMFGYVMENYHEQIKEKKTDKKKFEMIMELLQ